MATIRITAECDWCEDEEAFESAEEFVAGDWWTVLWRDEEYIYCCRECLLAALQGESDPAPRLH